MVRTIVGLASPIASRQSIWWIGSSGSSGVRNAALAAIRTLLILCRRGVDLDFCSFKLIQRQKSRPDPKALTPKPLDPKAPVTPKPPRRPAVALASRLVSRAAISRDSFSMRSRPPRNSRQCSRTRLLLFPSIPLYRNPRGYMTHCAIYVGKQGQMTQVHGFEPNAQLPMN